MKKVIIGLVVIFLAIGAYSLIIAAPGGHNRGDFDRDGYRRGPGMMGDYGGGYYREEMDEIGDKIYNNHENLIERNRDKIRDIMDEKYDIRRDIRDEMEKSSPSWSKISNLMDKNHSLSENIWKIRKSEQLKIMKSLSREERDLYMDHFRRGSMMNKRSSGGFRRGHHRGHMGY